ncbi:outer membrane beta-barrel protein [Draconibacterium sp. IB214405]|uniref:outer membrane beta-barrel protein n=1 Tax=Draconibacterium sp. IB214405 TaxID=3097352 RepID=UPI002A0C3224|nr:outer membrane beta-barrel protein [Draconibacterium sp. IB214405]MDX8340097.1 outer membrane beta-barrel protein [Draconibacterium sp. IB214405]
MKRTASLFIIALLMLCSASVMAQYPSVTFFGGANMATTDMKFGSVETDIEDSFDPLYGMNIGALYEYVLNKDKSQEIAVEGGLIFETKGYHQKLEESSYSHKNKTTLYFADVPVYLKYLYRFRSLNKIYVGAGGFVGGGLFGNEAITFQYAGAESSSNSESVTWGSEGDYKRLDYGVSAKCGFLMDSGFNICVSYDYGFADIATLESQEAKTRVLRLSLGYTMKFDD